MNEDAFDLADRIANPDGYADDAHEADRRAEKRDRIYRELLAIIERENQ